VDLLYEAKLNPLGVFGVARLGLIVLDGGVTFVAGLVAFAPIL
jgi:hypothetical protein